MGIGKGLDSTIGTYFFLQSSKNSANIYLSQQLLSQTEIRIRNNLHRYSECRRFLKVDNKWKRIISDKRDLGEELNPFVYIQIKTYDRNLNISGSTLSKPKIIYLPAQQFFKLYNTYEKKVIV